MPRKYLDQMMEEMEYANFHRWITSHASSEVSFNAPSVHSEYLNYINTSRYDFSSRGCYRPKYWLLPNLSKSNRESYYLVKRSEERSSYRNYQADKYYSKDNSFYQNRPKFDRGGDTFSVSGRRWNEFSSTNPYSERQRETRFAVRPARYAENEPESSSYQHNPNRRFVHDRLESPEMLNGKERDKDLDCPSGCPSSTSLKEYIDYQPSETQSQKNKSSTSQLSDVSVHTPSPETSTEYASWYNAEEQEEIVNMLREVNMRHDRQLQRDIMTTNSYSDESRYHSSMDDGHESDDEEDEEDDGITVLVSSEMALPLPETMIPEEVCNDYLQDKAPGDGIVEFKSIFVASPQKIIIDALTKEYSKDRNILTEDWVDSKVAGDLVAEERRNGSFIKEFDVINGDADNSMKENEKNSFHNMLVDNDSNEKCHAFSKENLKIENIQKEMDVETDVMIITKEELKFENNLRKDSANIKEKDELTKELLTCDKTQKEDAVSNNKVTAHTKENRKEKRSQEYVSNNEKADIITKEKQKTVNNLKGDGETNKDTDELAVNFKETITTEVKDSVAKENKDLAVDARLKEVLPSGDLTTNVTTYETEVCTGIKNSSPSFVENWNSKLSQTKPQDAYKISPTKIDARVHTSDKKVVLEKPIHKTFEESHQSIKTYSEHQKTPGNVEESKPKQIRPLLCSNSSKDTSENTFQLGESTVIVRNSKFKAASTSADSVTKDSRFNLKSAPHTMSKHENLPYVSHIPPLRHNISNFETKRGFKSIPPAFTTLKHVKTISNNNIEGLRQQYLFSKAFDTSKRIGNDSVSNFYVKPRPPNFKIVQICRPNVEYNINEEFQMYSPKLHRELNESCRRFFWRKIPYFLQQTGLSRGPHVKSDIQLRKFHPLGDEVKKTSFSETQLPFKNAEMHYKRISVAELFRRVPMQEKMDTESSDGNAKPNAVSDAYQNCESATVHLKHILRIGSSSEGQEKKDSISSKNCTNKESGKLPMSIMNEAPRCNAPNETFNSNSSNKTTNKSMSNEIEPIKNLSQKYLHESGNSKKKQLVQDNATARDIPRNLNVDDNWHSRSHNDVNYEETKHMESSGPSARNEREIKYSYANSRKSYYRKNNKLNQSTKWIPGVENIELIRGQQYKDNDKCKAQEHNLIEAKAEMVQKDQDGNSLESLKDQQNNNNNDKGGDQGYKTVDLKSETTGPAQRVPDDNKPETGTKQKSKKKAKNKSRAKGENHLPNDFSTYDEHPLQFGRKRNQGNFRKKFQQNELSSKEFSTVENPEKEILTQTKDKNSLRDKKNDKYYNNEDLTLSKEIVSFEKAYSEKRNANSTGNKETNLNKEIKCRVEMFDVDKNRKLHNTLTLPSKETSSENGEKKLLTTEISSTRYYRNKYVEKKSDHAYKEINTYSTEQRWKSDYYDKFNSSRNASSSGYNEQHNVCSRCHKFYNDTDYYERPRNTYFRSNTGYKSHYVNDTKYRVTDRETREMQTKWKDSTYSHVQKIKTESLKSIVPEEKAVLQSIYCYKDSSLPPKNIEVKSSSVSELKPKNGGSKSNIISTNENCQKQNSIDQTHELTGNKKRNYKDTTGPAAPTELNNGTLSLEPCNNSHAVASSDVSVSSSSDKNGFGGTSKLSHVSNLTTSHLNCQLQGKNNVNAVKSPTYEESCESEAKLGAPEVVDNFLNSNKSLSQAEGGANFYGEVLKIYNEVDNIKMESDHNEFSVNKPTSLHINDADFIQGYFKEQNESFHNISHTKNDICNSNTQIFPCQKTNCEDISNMSNADKFDAIENNNKGFSSKVESVKSRETSTENSDTLMFESEKSNPNFGSEVEIPESKRVSHKNNNQIKFSALGDNNFYSFSKDHTCNTENRQYYSQINVALNDCEKVPSKDCRRSNVDLNWVEKKTYLMVKQSKQSSKEIKYRKALSSFKGTRNVHGFSKSDTCLLMPHSRVLNLKKYCNATTLKNKTALISKNNKLSSNVKKTIEDPFKLKVKASAIVPLKEQDLEQFQSHVGSKNF